MYKTVILFVILFTTSYTQGQNSKIYNHVAENLAKTETIDRIDSIAKVLGIKPGESVPVKVAFEIDEKGEINILRIKSPHPVFDDEARKIIALLPKFEPAIKNGKPVAVKYLLPLKFVIETDKEKKKRQKREERKRKKEAK